MANMITPMISYQMIFVYCIMIVFIELFPLPPMAGSDIKKWKGAVWGIFYLVVIISYIFMNFTNFI